MLEGSMPVSVLVPSLHRLLHYGKQTKRFGRLQALAMWGFEQFNFQFKTAWIRNNSRPMTSAGLCFPHPYSVRNWPGLGCWKGVRACIFGYCLVLFLGFAPVTITFVWHVANSVTVHDAARYFAWKNDDEIDQNTNGVCRLFARARITTPMFCITCIELTNVLHHMH